MAYVSQVLEALERIAPARFALSYDRVGLQVGDPAAEVSRGVVSLDRSLGAVRFAAERGAQLLVSHHPLLFQPIGSVTPETHEGRTVLELVRHGIAFVAAHTNWDAASGGINDELASILRLRGATSFGLAAEPERQKLVVFAPRANVEELIDALAAEGAGEIGCYDRCAFTSKGVGTFRGGRDSHPAAGQAGRIERVDETRLETVVLRDRATSVIRRLREVHPYEEPAYDLIPLAPNAEAPIGRVGRLETPMALGDFVGLVDDRLETKSLAWGDPKAVIERVAVVGGAADSEWRAAQRAGAQALVTGEVKQHVALEAVESGFSIIAAGHYATEQPGCGALARRLREEASEVEWSVFAPDSGNFGRPLA